MVRLLLVIARLPPVPQIPFMQNERTGDLRMCRAIIYKSCVEARNLEREKAMHLHWQCRCITLI